MTENGNNEEYSKALTALENLLKTAAEKLNDLFSSDDFTSQEDLSIALNSWYYKQFNSYVFPIYKEEVLQSIDKQELLNHNEIQLCQNILYSFKHEAQSYNNLKQVSFYLDSFLSKIGMIQYQLEENSLKQGLLLYNEITALNNQCKTIHNSIKKLPSHTQLAAIRIAFKQYPAHYSLLPMLSGISSSDKKTIRFVEDIALQLQMQSELLEKLKNYGNYPSGVLENAIHKLIHQLVSCSIDKKTPLELRNWYKLYFLAEEQLLWENIEHHFNSSKSSDSLTMSIEKADNFISSLLVILRYLFLSENQSPAFPQLFHILFNQAENDKQEKNLELLISKIENYLKSFQTGKNPEISVIVNGAKPIIEEVELFFSELFQTISVGKSLSLLPDIWETHEKYVLCEQSLYMIEKTQNQSSDLLTTLANLTNIITQEISSLNDLIELKNRRLQTRQVEKEFKGLPIKIERWNLQKEKCIPKDCINKLNELKLQYSLPLDIRSIVGDIFIFQLGNESVCVIPYNIIKTTKES